MSNDIKVGDVCEIVGTCCSKGAGFVGLECLLVAAPTDRICACFCGSNTSDYFFASVPGAPTPSLNQYIPGSYAIPRAFLRKKPPKAHDQDDSRTDFTPAEPEFQQDLKRQLEKELVTDALMRRAFRAARRHGLLPEDAS